MREVATVEVMGLGGVACPKPPSRKLVKGRKDRAVAQHVKTIRGEVFADANETCVVCGWRAESMHEQHPASVMGSRVIATTRRNSVPVCGSGTTKCHGLLQSKIVRPVESKGKTRYWVDLSELFHPEVRALEQRLFIRGSGKEIEL